VWSTWFVKKHIVVVRQHDTNHMWLTWSIHRQSRWWDWRRLHHRTIRTWQQSVALWHLWQSTMISSYWTILHSTSCIQIDAERKETMNIKFNLFWLLLLVHCSETVCPKTFFGCSSVVVFIKRKNILCCVIKHLSIWQKSTTNYALLFSKNLSSLVVFCQNL